MKSNGRIYVYSLLVMLTWVWVSAHAQLNKDLRLVDLDGSNGVMFYGVNESDKSGYAVSSVGDLNGDGLDDIAISAPQFGIVDKGRVFVLFGSEAGFMDPFDLAGVDGLNGFVINGNQEGDEAGRSISKAGDVNGDGLDDMLIGAPLANPAGQKEAGSAYVVFGNDQAFPNPFELANINGLNGMVIHGSSVGDQAGNSVSRAGDVNGDGIDDIIIGAWWADPDGRLFAGKSYIIYGSDQGLPSPLFLSTVDGSNGFVVHGANPADVSGNAVSYAGDLNDDGIDDLIIGAMNKDLNDDQFVGSAYVVFGSDQGLPSPLNLMFINGLNGFEIVGSGAGHHTGNSVSYAGDVNGDGIDDVAIGAFRATENVQTQSGSVYVVYGSDMGFPNPFRVVDINGLNGLVINGEDSGDNLGQSVAYVGDVNGDSVDDLLLGAWGADQPGLANAGTSYLIWGNALGLPNPINTPFLTPSQGIRLYGEFTSDRAGYDVRSAGDVNGDGLDDVLIGAPFAGFEFENDIGKAYLIYGNDLIFANDFECDDFFNCGPF